MATTATVPITITPEAAERIRKLGVQRALDLMLEQARTLVPAVQSLEVILEPMYDLSDEPGLTIRAWSKDPDCLEGRPDREWGRWLLANFPPDVFRHFVLDVYGPGHAR